MLLSEAEVAFDNNRLTTPTEDSAYSKYRQVLTLDPDHQGALNGLSSIVEQYLSWAIEQSDASHHNRARHYIKKARDVNPAHPNIEPVLKMVADQAAAVKSDFPLDREAVNNRRVKPAFLEQIADLLKPETFVIIRAPNDAAGRWLYQELNARVSFRVQARFEASASPSLSLKH